MRKKKNNLLDKIFNQNPPTPFILGVIELKREGIPIRTRKDALKHMDKLIDRAKKINNTFCTLHRKEAYTSKVGRAYVDFIKERGTVKQYRNLLKNIAKAKKKRKR